MSTGHASEERGSMPVSKVGVIGGGLMGSGIAEVSARAGLDVVVVESTDEATKVATGRLEMSLERAEKRGRIESASAVLERICVVADLDAVFDRDLVVEAIVEDEGAKVALFQNIDDIVTMPDAILASNTSSIPIMKLGTVTSRPSQVIGIHFFNPVPVLDLVEIVPSLLTSTDTAER